MSKPPKTILPLKKVRNSFIVNLNKNVYRAEVIRNILTEDEDWIREAPTPQRNYVSLRLATTDIKDVLHWLNYLIYRHRD